MLYLDTSSLVKLYAPESESAAVKQLVAAADVAATSRVAYVELGPLSRASAESDWWV